jgi:hypothetical protein
MEPRPPRPRTSRQFDSQPAPPSSGIGDRLYPANTEPSSYTTASGDAYAPGMTGEQPLLPRQQRRQRGALRSVLATLLVVAAVAALAWYFRAPLQNLVSPAAPTPTVVAQPVSIGENPDLPLAATPGTTEEAPAAEDAPAVADLPNALATVTPTAVPAAATSADPVEEAEQAAAEEEPEAAAEPDRDISAQTLPLLDFLPTQEQVPAGLVLADEAERSKQDVAAALGGTDEATQLLDDWGWSGNAFRDFVLPQDAEPGPSGTTFLNVSVHRFADAESAANALIFFSDQVVISQGLEDVEAPAIGESARLLQGAPDEVPLTILYVQDGPIMYRMGGSSANADSDPTAAVLAVAQAIIPEQ